MAIVKNNIITQGTSGMLGDQLVFRRSGNRTIMAKPPAENNSNTVAQQAVRTTFQEAVIYAKAQLEDPATRAPYDAAAASRPNVSAFNVAVADYYKAPDIQAVDVGNYTGQLGDTIGITVTDDFQVHQVLVSIENTDGTVVESGLAVQQNSAQWLYTATTNNLETVGDRIVVQAQDGPGNITQQQAVLN